MALVDTGLYVPLNPNGEVLFPEMEKPRILGCYSVDTNRTYKASAENLRYFRMPQKFPLDLNEGYGLANSKEERLKNERLDHLLRFIKDHQDELLSKPGQPSCKGVGDFDFICFRGLLNLIMCTPYESREEWCIHATRYKGNIYLCHKETDQQRDDRQSRDKNHQKFMAYGFKFEQFCLTTNPAEEPNTSLPVDECEDFSCVYKTKLQGMKIMYVAETDGVFGSTAYQNVESKDVLSTMKFVELKCCIKPVTKRQQQSFLRYKCKKWWCQCFLAGIKDVIVGYRNGEGLISEIKRTDVRSLAEMAASFWTPSQFADFLVKFLQTVKNLMRNIDCPYTVYEFYFNPVLGVISYRVYGGKSSHTILPDWYVEMLQHEMPIELK